MTDIRSRLVDEWPAVLAVLVLILGHIVLTISMEEEMTPLGIPLIAAIAVFLVAEVARRLV